MGNEELWSTCHPAISLHLFGKGVTQQDCKGSSEILQESKRKKNRESCSKRRQHSRGWKTGCFQALER